MLAEPENKSSALELIHGLFFLVMAPLILGGPAILAWVIFTFGLSLSPEFAIELTVLVSAGWFTYLIIYILYNHLRFDL